jgi:hypothetical protein
MNKAPSVDALTPFKSTSDDFPRWELSILHVANKYGILAHLFEEQELKSKYPSLTWTPCAENPGTIDFIINPSNKENVGLSLSDQITLFKYKSEQFKTEQAAVEALRLVVVTSLPEAVRSLYESVHPSGIFAPLKAIYVAVKSRYGASDAQSHLRSSSVLAILLSSWSSSRPTSIVQTRRSGRSGRRRST